MDAHVPVFMYVNMIFHECFHVFAARWQQLGQLHHGSSCAGFHHFQHFLGTWCTAFRVNVTAARAGLCLCTHTYTLRV
jgi:hypothetical protein